MNVLVTGGGGFLGGSIVRLLVARGDRVRSLSRSRYAALDALQVEQFQGDVADAGDVEAAAAGCDVVFHVAAKAGVAGRWRDYYRANVVGTENVLAACQKLRIGRLVYTSSPSVVFDGRDMEGVDESVPYPKRHEAHYPATKAIAERLVLSANGSDLATVALRPHLIWGPGDNHLVPRILERGRAGRLRRIGRGEKPIDSVYIDNAAEAHLLAADRLQSPPPRSVLPPRGGREETQARSASEGAPAPPPSLALRAPPVAGRAYFISNGEPVPLWDLVNRILAAGGVAPVTKSIPVAAALGAGWVMETVYRVFRPDAEPPMTRFVARELATAHWFDISAARRDLGYVPRVSLEEGMRRLTEWLKPRG
jgi:nucleoside-diphosphate-sugar epimerase